MDSVAIVVSVVTVVASLGAALLVALLLRHLVLSRRIARDSPPVAVAPDPTWQERAAMYEASGQYADYKCPYVPHGEATDDSEVVAKDQ